MTQRRLVDTHIWLWYAEGNRQRLSPAAAKRLQRWDAQERLCLSVMSIWELGMLDAKARIHLGLPIRKWLEAFFQRTRFELLGLDIDIVLAANQLPGLVHPDPVDRILIATSRHHGLTLVTEDRKILDYARQGYVQACASSSGRGLLRR